MASDAQKKAIKKYDEKFFMIRFRMNNEKYEAVKKLCEKRNESIAAFFNKLADKELNQEEQ